MYLPLWGVAIILTLCLTGIWAAGSVFFDLVVLKNLGAVTKYFTLPVLAILVVLHVWVGYQAITFNMKQE